MGRAQILSLPPQISYYLFPEPQFVISEMGRGLMAPVYASELSGCMARAHTALTRIM